MPAMKEVKGAALKSATLRNRVCVPVDQGNACFCTFNGLLDDKEHFALVFNAADEMDVPLVRMHSECITGDLFHSKRCDCGDQLQESLSAFEEKGGVLLYLRQEGRGIGLYNKLDAYSLQLQGLDTYEANEQLHLADDLRTYDVAAQMLKAMNITRIRLMTNNPEKVKQLRVAGVEVVERIGTGSYVKPENYSYLSAKVKKTGHYLSGFQGALS